MDRDLAQKKTHNSEQSINRILPEILVAIWAAFEDEQRAKRYLGFPYSGSQDLAVQVCSHWRNLAISLPSLWTYIYISKPPPHHHASLYLARAGSTALLDIELQFRSSYLAGVDLNDWTGQVRSIGETLCFLQSYGASATRWRSLIVCAKRPQVLFKTIAFINSNPPSALRFLSLQLVMRVRNVELDRIDTECLSYPNLFDDSHSISCDNFPQLHSVNFYSMPAGFLGNRPGPLLSGLTHLVLTSGRQKFSLAMLHTLLLANPQLESLSLAIRDSNLRYEAPSDESLVVLQALRSLAIHTEPDVAWGLGVIQMIGAPALKRFELRAQVDRSNMSNIAKCIAPRGADPSQIPRNGKITSHRPIYPLLEHFSLNVDYPDGYSLKPLRRLFTALSTVTCLRTTGDNLSTLGKPPWVFPKLNRLEYIGNFSTWELRDILQRRAEAGFPLRTFEVYCDEFDSGIVGRFLAEHTKVVERIYPIINPYYPSEDDI